MQLMMIGFDTREDGETAFEALDDARHDDEILLDDLALVYRNDRGRVKVKQTNDAGLGKGLVRGGVLGLLVGVIAPVGAVAATVVGGALGAIVTAFDEGVDNGMMKALGKTLETRESVVLCLGEQTQIDLLAKELAPYTDSLQYEVVPEASQNMIKEMSKLSLSDI